MPFNKMIWITSILYYLVIIYMPHITPNKTRITRKIYKGGIDEPTGNPPVGLPVGSPESIQPETPVEDAQTEVPIESPIESPVESPVEDPVQDIQQEVPVETPIESPVEEVQPEVIEEGPVESSVPPPPSQDMGEPNELEGEVAVGTVGTGETIAASGTAPLDQSKEIEDFRQNMADPANQTDYLFLNENISTEPNKNKSYVRVGILHFTDSAAINVLRDTITSIGNLFGSKGIDNIIYDKLRNTVLTKVGIILGENRRCYNTTVQIERIDDSIFAHVYGTLYEKKSV